MNHYEHTTHYEVDQTELLLLRRSVARAMPHLSWRHHRALGVLQAYLSETDPEVRVHIWHQDLLDKSLTDSGRIHDHRFGLCSTVLLGRVSHDEYLLGESPRGAWRMWAVQHARKGEAPLTPLEGRFSAEIIRGSFSAGERYFFQRGYFHRSEVVEPAVTVVAKYQQQHDTQARVLVPHDFTPSFGVSVADEALVSHHVARAVAELLEAQ